ncbi:hypothetical protein BDK92_2684 [Micromonospora pisi]|uniref:Uncharacterized protein n=2 Tax=Micromonospora pisi TaxID=589240 RepID=A0A495JHJ6_9ACTN|nr:hypothetical protein BDK92_2684 [Micromonospora pisi]
MAAGYRTAHPNVRPEDLLAVVPASICYTASSVYPYEDLVLGQALLPEQLQAYARDRQEALLAVMENATAATDALREGIETS